MQRPGPAGPRERPTRRCQGQRTWPRPGGNTGYGLAALRREVAELLATEHGENNRLNQAAFALGMLVAGGELELATVETQLEEAGLSLGLHPAEVSRTIASGMREGMRRPRG